jgi:hypothetical protein
MQTPASTHLSDVAGIAGVHVFEEALPGSLFERLARAIRAVGRERFKRNYTTTFWFPLGDEPSNVAEEAIMALMPLADPGPDCVGIEWWLGRLRQGQKLRMHFDRDMTLRKETGQFVHPLRASALYLNSYPSSPTVILDQVPGPDGRSRVPRKAERRASIEPMANRYSVFPGNLRHGVVPISEGDDAEAAGEEIRLSFLVNYWDRRPLPPLCFDYDGTIYPALKRV